MTRKHVHDPRPCIRDAAAFGEPASAGLVATASIGMVVLALAAGFAIGFAAFPAMGPSTWPASPLRDGATGGAPVPRSSLAACALGGLPRFGAALPAPRALLAANEEGE